MSNFLLYVLLLLIPGALALLHIQSIGCQVNDTVLPLGDCGWLSISPTALTLLKGKFTKSWIEIKPLKIVSTNEDPQGRWLTVNFYNKKLLSNKPLPCGLLHYLKPCY